MGESNSPEERLRLPKSTYAARDLWNSQDLGDAAIVNVILHPLRRRAVQRGGQAVGSARRYFKSLPVVVTTSIPNQLSLFGNGYYGSSYVPGLVPINVPVPGDTIDDRQLDYTHNFLALVADNWKLGEQRQLSFSGFFRNYALTLRSNFGDGLIQQSETRNVFDGEALFIQSMRHRLAVMAGVDLRRDAPRNLDLKHIDDNGVFQPVTGNDLTLSFVEPFVSFDGTAGRYLHFNVGVRQEEVSMDNQDLINPQNSFNKLATLTLPKATITLLPPDKPVGSEPIERIVGVPLKSYVSLSWTYYFGR